MTRERDDNECYCTTDTCTTPCERCKVRCAVGTDGVCDSCYAAADRDPNLTAADGSDYVFPLDTLAAADAAMTTKNEGQQWNPETTATSAANTSHPTEPATAPTKTTKTNPDVAPADSVRPGLTRRDIREWLADAYEAGYNSALDDPNRTRTDEDIDTYCERFGYEQLEGSPAREILALLEDRRWRAVPPSLVEQETRLRTARLLAEYGAELSRARLSDFGLQQYNDGYRLGLARAMAIFGVTQPTLPDPHPSPHGTLVDLGTSDTGHKPRRFVVDANDEDNYYVEESDGRVFKLESGGFLKKDGMPAGADVTTYTPESAELANVAPAAEDSSTPEPHDAIDRDLLAALEELGRRYGALGVAKVAARFTDRAVLIHALETDDVTHPTPEGLTTDKVHLSEARNESVSDETDSGPIGESDADAVGPPPPGVLRVTSTKWDGPGMPVVVNVDGDPSTMDHTATMWIREGLERIYPEAVTPDERGLSAGFLILGNELAPRPSADPVKRCAVRCPECAEAGLMCVHERKALDRADAVRDAVRAGRLEVRPPTHALAEEFARWHLPTAGGRDWWAERVGEWTDAAFRIIDDPHPGAPMSAEERQRMQDWYESLAADSGTPDAPRCTEISIPAGWTPATGLTPAKTAVSHAFRAVEPGELCQCGRAAIDDDGSVVEVPWHCEAYGPDGAEHGLQCFVSPDNRTCADPAECHRIMTGERSRVFGRIQELAAEGDPVGIDLAAQFTSPEQILGGSESPVDPDRLAFSPLCLNGQCTLCAESGETFETCGCSCHTDGGQ